MVNPQRDEKHGPPTAPAHRKTTAPQQLQPIDRPYGAGRPAIAQRQEAAKGARSACSLFNAKERRSHRLLDSSGHVQPCAEGRLCCASEAAVATPAPLCSVQAVERPRDVPRKERRERGRWEKRERGRWEKRERQRARSRPQATVRLRQVKAGLPARQAATAPSPTGGAC